MRFRSLLVATLLLSSLAACDKKEDAKPDSAKGEQAEKKEEPAADKEEEKVADKEPAAPDGATADSAACDAKKELASFLDLMAAGSVDDMTAKAAFPFSGDGNRWVENAEKFKEGFDGPKPFEAFDIKALEDESGLSENKTKWVAEVRGKYADVQIFDVAATVKDKDEPMTALWFVDGATCKVVGLDD